MRRKFSSKWATAGALLLEIETRLRVVVTEVMTPALAG